MRRKSVVAGGIAVAALVLIATAITSGSAVPAAKEDADFDGKIVWVLNHDGKGCYLERVCTKRLGDRAFLVGTRVKNHASDPDLPEVTLYMPVNDLKALSVFNTIDDARRFAAALGTAPKDR
jgi:hypothetical protein